GRVCYSPKVLPKVRSFTWVPAASAALMLVAVYGSWAVAWAQLGRRPRPSMDDPRHIGGLATDVHTFSVWMIGFLAVVLVVAFLVRLRSAAPEATRRDGRLRNFM